MDEEEEREGQSTNRGRRTSERSVQVQEVQSGGPGGGPAGGGGGQLRDQDREEVQHPSEDSVRQNKEIEGEVRSEFSTVQIG